MEVFAQSPLCKVAEMPDFDVKSRFDNLNHDNNFIAEDIVFDEDLLMEQILKNINTTPIGRVLKKIASLPEVRREKVLDVRRQLTEGKYDLNDRLDIALDKVLEKLIT
jgi:hypothetical protein